MREQIQPLPCRQQRHQFWWLMPKPFDWLSSSLYIGIFILAFLLRLAAWQIPLLAVVLLALLLIDRLEYWRYGEQVSVRVAVSLFIARLVLIECTILIEGFNFTPFLYLITPYLAVVYFGNRAGYTLGALVIAAYLARVWRYQPDWYLNTLSVFLALIFTFGVVFVVSTAQVVRLEKEGRIREQASRVQAEGLLMEVKHAHRQLQAYAEQVAALATLEERNRVAREIHDSLGHALMAINLQLEKALVYHDSHPQEAVQAIRDAKCVAKDALQDVRRSVRALRTEQEAFSCTRAIELLVEQVRASSLLVDFVVTGSEETFPQQTLMTLYRVAQEAFTNIQKHAQASCVQISLHFAGEEASLRICDDGCGFDAAAWMQQPERLEEGYGLRGMQERLTLVGGNFHLQSQLGRGTQISVTVPGTGMALPDY